MNAPKSVAERSANWYDRNKARPRLAPMYLDEETAAMIDGLLPKFKTKKAIVLAGIRLLHKTTAAAD